MTQQIALETLRPEEYSIAKPFFKGVHFYTSYLHSILDQTSLGTVFTDDRNDPSFLLVCSPNTASNLNAPVYLGGEPDPAALRKIRSFLKTLPKVALVVPLDWKHRSYFEQGGFKPVERVQLRRRSRSFETGPWKQSLPRQYSISEIHEETFLQCNWRPFVLSCYGDYSRFLTHATGFCILDQGKVASESYALFLAKGQGEVGVVTDPKYRGQNLGTILSAVALDYFYKRNLEPYWNCDVQNPQSTAIAKKLGFEEDYRYLLLKWLPA